MGKYRIAASAGSVGTICVADPIMATSEWTNKCTYNGQNHTGYVRQYCTILNTVTQSDDNKRREFFPKHWGMFLTGGRGSFVNKYQYRTNLLDDWTRFDEGYSQYVEPFGGLKSVCLCNSNNVVCTLAKINAGTGCRNISGTVQSDGVTVRLDNGRIVMPENIVSITCPTYCGSATNAPAVIQTLNSQDTFCQTDDRSQTFIWTANVGRNSDNGRIWSKCVLTPGATVTVNSGIYCDGL